MVQRKLWEVLGAGIEILLQIKIKKKKRGYRRPVPGSV